LRQILEAPEAHLTVSSAWYENALFLIFLGLILDFTCYSTVGLVYWLVNHDWGVCFIFIRNNHYGQTVDRLLLGDVTFSWFSHAVFLALVQTVLGASSLSVPSKQSSIMSTRPKDEMLGVVTDSHDVVFVHYRFKSGLGVHNRPISVSLDPNNIWSLVLFFDCLVSTYIPPNTNSAVPADSSKLDVLIFDALVLVAQAGHWSNFPVDLLSPDLLGATTPVSLYFFEDRAIGEIPNLNVASLRGGHQSTVVVVKANGRYFALVLRSTFSCTVLRHQLAILNVPYVDETRVVTRDNWVKLMVVQCIGHFTFMRCRNFFLCSKRPQVDFARA
jgi:hypothetical protein